MTQVIEKQQEKGGYLLTHDAIRRDLSRYETLAYKITNPSRTDINNLSGWFTFFWGIIEHHHVNEDAYAFPWIIEKNPALKQKFEVLTEDHHELERLVSEIHRLLSKVKESNNTEDKTSYYRNFQEIASTLKVKMFDHLEREEALFIPATAELFTKEEQEENEKFLMKRMSFKLLSTFAPWMFDGVAEEDTQKFLKGTPLMLRVLYILSWKPKYAKTMAGFGL